MLSNRTTDFLTVLEDARTPDDLWSRSADYLAAIGFTHSVYSYIDTHGAPRVWTSLPTSWRDHYLDQQYRRNDPFFRYCCRTLAPIRTGPEYLDDYNYLTASERRIIREAGETGFRSGFSSPVGLVGSGIGFGGWNFGSTMRRSELESFLREHGSDLRLAGLYIHSQAERLLRAGEQGPPSSRPLSPRERECLLWLSRGLRTAAIADRLGIAMITVNLHLKGARQKLNAATREEALAKAILRGLIHP